MNVSPSIQKLIVSLIILGVLGYVVFTTIFSSEPPIVAEGVPVETVGQDILVLADKLNNIKIEKNIFSSPLFTNLIDNTTPIADEPVGRINPFAKIGDEGGSSQVRTTTARP